MVFDPEGNIPRVRDATYYNSKIEAIVSAINFRRITDITGRAPIKFVQPGREDERVFVDDSTWNIDNPVKYLFSVLPILSSFARVVLALFMGTSLESRKKRPGLFRVIDPGMGIPGIHDAVYWYTKAEAIASAIRIWNANHRMGGPLIDFVQPGEDLKHIFVDYKRLREESPTAVRTFNP